MLDAALLLVAMGFATLWLRNTVARREWNDYDFLVTLAYGGAATVCALLAFR